MKLAWGWMVFCLMAVACGAQSAGDLADIRIIDQASGAYLPITRYRGDCWVAGRPGARYGIEVTNRTGERVLAVTSVDGVDVLSGATASWDQGGYVFAPHEAYQISGWRKTDQQVAAFVFTAAGNSYAERTGRPANVGVIGVALFRERVANDVEGTPQARLRRSESADAAASARAYPAPNEKLGTGHGEREYSYVTQTQFNRIRPLPDQVIRIRYDSSENLIAMGVIRKPRSLPPEPNPFPGSPGTSYVPDPPG